MFPETGLSTDGPIGRFLDYYPKKRDPKTDICKAGLAINDPSLGLNYQLWKAKIYDNGDIFIANESDNYIAETFIVNIPGGTNVSLAFDNNMTPVVSAIADDDLKLYWYDATVSSYVTLSIADVLEALVRIDDVRDSASPYRRVVLTYIKNGALYCRVSSNRYTVEYLLKSVHEWQKLYQCGMTDQLRFQFTLVWDSQLMREC
jgi:hypothetical protein